MKMPDRETMKRLILKEPEGDFTAGNPEWTARNGCIWYESDRLNDQDSKGQPINTEASKVSRP